jgi:hypothetical protein
LVVAGFLQAWEGYNCSLFAYGQTGSGKSYSVMGYGPNKGIVPLLCDKIFQEIEEKGADAQVSVSMLEIYNECVYDLLSNGKRPKGGMKIRNHPQKGFYVHGLAVKPVHNFAAIDGRIEEGTKNRTIGSTAMNATSSRAHTIVTILFSQKTTNAAGEGMTKTASINLVDLAGSERAESTGATGDRLKEGSAINQSLSSLGNVIKALADQSKGGKKVMVPYRNSVLTMLLKSALAGNSKTIMCAALSPADINYEETLSTLRFADRAKAIKTKAVVNETPTERLIRELREENLRLMEMLKGGGPVPDLPPVAGASPATAASSGGQSDEEIKRIERAKIKAIEEKEAVQAELDRQMKENAEAMRMMEQSYEEKLARELKMKDAQDEAQRLEAEAHARQAYIWNMNEDPALEGKVQHFMRVGTTTIGTNKAVPPNDIVLRGLNLLERHACVEFNDGVLTMEKASEGSKILVNGEQLEAKTELHHHDRLLIGSTHLFCVEHPHEREAGIAGGKKWTTPHYADAQAEIAAAAGITTGTGGEVGTEAQAIQDDLVTMMPHVNEANAISQELDKKSFFEVVLVVDENHKTAIKVKVHDLVRQISWMWSRSTFLNRKYIMQEMYQQFTDEEEWDRPQKEDPFWEPVQHQLLGTAFLYLSSLAHMIDLEEDLTLSDIQGRDIGHVMSKIDLCSDKGVVLAEEEAEDLFVEEPDELVGTKANFLLTVQAVNGVPHRSSAEVYCAFQFMDSPEQETQRVSGINPKFDFKYWIAIPKVTRAHIDYFAHKAIKISVYSKRIPQTDPAATSKTTVELINDFRMGGNDERKGKMSMQLGGTVGALAPARSSDVDAGPDEAIAQKMTRLQQELTFAKRRAQRMDTKLQRVIKLVRKAQADNEKTISTDEIAQVLHVKRPNRFKGVVRTIMMGNRMGAWKKSAAASALDGVGGSGGGAPLEATDKVAPPDNAADKSATCLVM